jgi:hypothetical protein
MNVVIQLDACIILRLTEGEYVFQCKLNIRIIISIVVFPLVKRILKNTVNVDSTVLFSVSMSRNHARLKPGGCEIIFLKLATPSGCH